MFEMTFLAIGIFLGYELRFFLTKKKEAEKE